MMFITLALIIKDYYVCMCVHLLCIELGFLMQVEFDGFCRDKKTRMLCSDACCSSICFVLKLDRSTAS